MMQAGDEKPEALGRAVRRLARSVDRAALATTLADGRPYASLVLLAWDFDGAPLLLLSDLAEHSRNLARDPRQALLIDGTGGLADPLTGPRASLIGKAAPVGHDRLLARFLARHPSAETYAGFADFKLYRVTLERAHFVAGFGRIRWIEGKELRLVGDCDGLARAEAALLAELNGEDGSKAEKLLGRGPGWRLTGLDPEGADLRRKGETARIEFAAPVWDAASLRDALRGNPKRAS
jgi:putative heme iron utilization protein